jgi:NitT/TauT family transport system substrate-binding protein
MQIIRDRRSFLTGLSAIGAAGLLGNGDLLAAAEQPPETTSVRLPRYLGGAICWAAEYLAGEMLRAEGIIVRFVQGDRHVDHAIWITRGAVDLGIHYVPNHIQMIDAGVPIKVLTGLHSGCLEVIASDNVRRVADLRGKRVGTGTLNSSQHTWLKLMTHYIGLDPVTDIEWVSEQGDPTQLFIDGKIDAYLGTPPWPQALRAKKIGHTLISTTTDKPWSQHFCCMISGSSDYVEKYPITTKRILKAILKAADICASNPSWAAQQLVDRKFVPRYDYAFQTLSELRYDRWRDFDAEDALRFYALRMQEIGMIKSSPQEIIAKGADWRILNELKHELKA